MDAAEAFIPDVLLVKLGAINSTYANFYRTSIARRRDAQYAEWRKDGLKDAVTNKNQEAVKY